MNPHPTDPEIEKLLATPVPPPPPELIEAIKSDIALVEATSRSAPSTRNWLVAACVIVALGAGILTSRLLLFRAELPLPDSETARVTEASRKPLPDISEIPEVAEAAANEVPPVEVQPSAAAKTGHDQIAVERGLEHSLEGDQLTAAGGRSTATFEGETLSTPDPVPAEQPAAKSPPTVDTESAELRREAAAAHTLPSPSLRAQAAVDAKLDAFESKLKQLAEEPAAPARRIAEVPSLVAASPVITVPNDAPYQDVFFHGHGVNPFVDTDDDNLSTFGLDVDTASYSVVRRFLNDGHLPPADAVRVEELVNYLDYGDPRLAPEPGHEFTVSAEGAPALFAPGEGYRVLRIHLQGREIATEARPPSDLVFVIDTSGSMAQNNRLELVKRSLDILIDGIGKDDRVALITFGSDARVVVEPTHDLSYLRRAVSTLGTGGSTNAEAGLLLGYELAADSRRRGPAIRRVILCSDGVANVGHTAAEQMLDSVRSYAQQGIELTTVGFGMGNYNDHLMETLADSGNGRYAYVDTLHEAQRIFVEELTGTLLTIAAEARAQIEFDPSIVSRYRLLGYENRNIADERFRDDTVDAGEIGAGHRLTVLYQLKLHHQPKRTQPIATIRLRYASIASGTMVEQELQVRGEDFAASWDMASPALRMSSLVADFAEVLKETYWARETDLGEVFRRAQRAAADLAASEDRAAIAELVSLIGKAETLRR